MSPLRVAAAALAGLAVLAACFSERGPATAPTGACNVPLTPGQRGSTIIAISGFAFDPPSARIKTNTKVTWVNCETEGTPGHTTTSDQTGWSSPVLDPGNTFTQTFTTAGTFAYHCEPHPFMTATIVVEN